MGEFLKDYWIWIVAPIVLVAVAVLALAYLGAEDDEAAPFVYSTY